MTQTLDNTSSPKDHARSGDGPFPPPDGRLAIDGLPAEAASAPRSRADGVGFGVVPIAAGVAGVMFSYGEFFADAAAFVVVFALLGLWAWRSASPVPRVALAVLLTLFVAINLVYAIPDLRHPESALPFISSATVIVAGLVTAVLGYRAARRRPAAGLVVWMISFAGLGLLSVGSLIAASQVQSDMIGERDTAITAKDVEFPSVVEVAADSQALVVRNGDLVRHTLVVEGQERVVELPAESTRRIPLNLAPGTYEYYCNISGHEQMQGTLVVGG